MSAPQRPRADDNEPLSSAYFGIGTVQAISGEAPTDDEHPEPGIWLPMHRSGSRCGGWRRQPVIAPRRVIGFRRP